ncbi:MAG: von Willebrand factor type A domain-containing protein [Flavobacteriales bacterium]|nr:von Willebrand factor type A domain-containing protein [Flavobacteriales bacterium]
MRFALAFLTLFLVSSAFSQTGGIVISFDRDTSISQDSITVEIWRDSTFLFDQKTIDHVIARELPVGKVDLYCSYLDSFFVYKQAVYVQPKQLVYQAFEVDSNLLAIRVGGAGDYSLSNDPSITRNTITRGVPTLRRSISIDANHIQTYNSAEVMEIESVMITAYRAPLIVKDGGASGTTTTREDITIIPARSAYGIAGTVGGVNQTEDALGLHFRGGRAEQNAYYLDGMRLNSLDGIPKSYIQEVQVLTGGIPACYGDATGGIVSIYGKSYLDIARERSQQAMNRSSSSYSTPYYQSSSTYEYVEPEFDKLNFDRFSEIYENDFLSPLTSPNSTFGIDVDRASWTFIKTKFHLGQTIHRDAVKLEEMLNSFKHTPAQIKTDELIGVELERNNCAWNSENELVTIRVRAADLPKDSPRKHHNIVLLVDVSGSMTASNKLPLLVQGFKDFVKGLEQGDRISIVTYAGESGVRLMPTTCDQKQTIYDALSGLVSGGSTNGIGGIRTAYELAEQYYDPSFNNRIILATDGDFNVGIHSTTELEEYISTKRGKGIYLTALGFGMGNYRNDLLETLADRGDGNHFYINDLKTAYQVLSEDIGNLINIARDVKLNVEFNPAFVESYRLLGYENRLMPAKDFDDDTKDGGEMGYGHSVIAVYEIVRGKETKAESHFTKTKASFNREELAFVKLRYKRFEDSTSIERKFSLSADSKKVQNNLVNLVAAFGLTLRNSVFKGTLTNDQLVRMAKDFRPKNEEEEQLRKMILSLD